MSITQVTVVVRPSVAATFAFPGPQGAPGQGITGIEVNEEVPAGPAFNGVNNSFILAHPPIAGSVKLYKNGMRNSYGLDYTVSGTTLSFAAGNIPQSGDSVVVDYRR